MNDWIKEENERIIKFYEILGDNLGYTGKRCINCGRARVEKYSSGNEICEKCGFEQKTKQYYENEYGRFDDLV